MRVVVCSGKGGVGKTTISLAIAKALSKRFKVGLLDCDVTGANTHLQVDLIEDFRVESGTLYPARAKVDGSEIEYVSIALVSESYVKWSGETVGEFINQVMNSTNWSADFIIMDAPPGTHEDTIKAIEVSDVVIFVTIPTEFAKMDLERIMDLVRDMGKPVAGVIVNFTKARCPDCGAEFRLFDCDLNPEVPVIQEIPFGNIEIDAENLLKHLHNPVKLKKKSRKIKRGMVKFLLKAIGGVDNVTEGDS